MRRGKSGHSRVALASLADRLPTWPEVGHEFYDEDSDRLIAFEVDDSDRRRALVAGQMDGAGRWVKSWNEVEGWHEVYAIGDARFSETDFEHYQDALESLDRFLAVLFPWRRASASWLLIKAKARRVLDRRAANPAGPHAPGIGFGSEPAYPPTRQNELITSLSRAPRPGPSAALAA